MSLFLFSSHPLLRCCARYRSVILIFLSSPFAFRHRRRTEDVEPRPPPPCPPGRPRRLHDRRTPLRIEASGDPFSQDRPRLLRRRKFMHHHPVSTQTPTLLSPLPAPHVCSGREKRSSSASLSWSRYTTSTLRVRPPSRLTSASRAEAGTRRCLRSSPGRERVHGCIT